MQIILSKNCLALQGLIGRDYGYHIECRKQNFYAVRNTGHVPPDGHWRFIVLCAELAHNGLYIKDIKVSQDEVRVALLEAGHHTAMWNLKLNKYDARDILNLKTTFGL